MVFRSLSHVTQNLTAVVNPGSEDLRLSIGIGDKKKYCFPDITDLPAVIQLDASALSNYHALESRKCMIIAQSNSFLFRQ